MGEENDDDQRVHDGKPLDVGVRHRVQDVVPAGGPFHFRGLPNNGVGVDHVEVLGVGTDGLRSGAQVAVHLVLAVVFDAKNGKNPKLINLEM